MPGPIASAPSDSSAPLRVLIVEDESLVALDLEERPMEPGYEVTGMVDDGAEAAIPKSATLVLDLADGLPPLRADRSRLHQVIMNLVINGSDALGGQAGTLTLRTARFHAMRQFLAGCRVGADLGEGDYILLEATDTGHGMTGRAWKIRPRRLRIIAPSCSISPCRSSTAMALSRRSAPSIRRCPC